MIRLEGIGVAYVDAEAAETEILAVVVSDICVNVVKNENCVCEQAIPLSAVRVPSPDIPGSILPRNRSY